jgi:PKD repeat protein
MDNQFEVDPNDQPPQKAPEKAAEPAPVEQRQPKNYSVMPEQTQQKSYGVNAQNAGKAPKKSGPPKISAKLVMTLVGVFGSLALVFLVLSFVFVSQTTEGSNPIARMIGIQNDAAFVNGLISFIHVIFIFVALTVFVFTMIGLFKAAMAKKDDKETRKKGIKTSLFAGLLLIVVIILWMFAYLYLDSKRIQGPEEFRDPIVTDPEETFNLTAPIEVRFDASGVDVKRGFQVISYEWDFGDDETGTNQIVAHTFEEKGRYDVMLTVTQRNKDSNEELETEYAKVITIANQALSAIFTATPQTGEAPLEVELDATASVDPDGTIDRYEWDLDEDGNYDDSDNDAFTHTFDKIGRYTVGLRVVSTTGEYDITEKEIIVEEMVLPEAVVTIDGEPEQFEVGKRYIFKAADSTSPNGNIEEYEWDFGDGTDVETTKTVAHSFEERGSYELILKVVDEEGEEGETKMRINVGSQKGAPNAVIKTESQTGTVPFTVIFDASDSTDSDENIVDYAWDFDDDGEMDSYGDVVSHTYTEQGTYTVLLEVTDSDSNVGTAIQLITVEAQGVVADIKASENEGEVPLVVTFDASGSTYEEGDIVSYQWDFGDDSSPKIGTSTITHKYNKIGIFTVSVTAVGSDNKKNTAEIIINVREIALQACFESVLESGEAPLETEFDPACSSGTIARYFWKFGDGETSTSIKPEHTYTDAGEYTVELEVADSENNLSTSQMVITVE